MTSLSHRYHDFGSAAGETEGIGEDVMQDEKLQSFEAGYQAGWDDAVKAHANERDRAATEMAQRLQDMSFTFHEAHGQLCTAMRPVLHQIVTKVLPVAAHATLGQQLTDMLAQTVAQNAQTGIEIAVAPEQLTAMRETLDQGVKLPFQLTAEPSLSAGQVYLRSSTVEREINLDLVLDSMAEALDAFFLQSRQEIPNG